MPVPSPKKGESKQEFVSRCIKVMHQRDPNRTNAQIAAMCYGAWNRRNLESTFTVKLGETETQMILPKSAEGILDIGEVWLGDEPPVVKQPFTAKAVYQHHWFRGKAKPIRVGPSTEYWHLRFPFKGRLMTWTLRSDVTEADQASCVFEWSKQDWMTRGKQTEEIKPGQPGNPTKDTPAYIEIVDSGSVRIYETTDMFVKLDIRMKKLKGHFIIVRRDERMNLWTIQKEEKQLQAE